MSIVPCLRLLAESWGNCRGESRGQRWPHSHGKTVARHGIRTNQLKEGHTFVAFDGAYRWHSGSMGKFCN